MQKNRIYYIDCLRVFASFLVVLIHCNFIPENPENKIYTQILNVIGSPSSELFLAISGSLLIPVKVSEKEFYKKRFARLLIPLFFWSLFGILWKYLFHNITYKELPFFIFSIPFKSVIIGPYWFMYAIIGMYLVAPIITPYLNQSSKRKIEILLLLWCISLIMPYTNLIFNDFYSLNGDFSFPLYNFSGYLGYMVLGYYLRKNPLNINMAYIILLYIATIIPIALVGMYFPSYRNLVLGNLQILSAIQVTLIFTFFQKFFLKENTITNIASFFTNYTFGIYLIHVFVIECLYKIIGGPEKYNIVFELPFIIISGFFISFLIVFFLSKIKFLKKILGVNK